MMKFLGGVVRFLAVVIATFLLFAIANAVIHAAGIVPPGQRWAMLDGPVEFICSGVVFILIGLVWGFADPRPFREIATFIATCAATSGIIGTIDRWNEGPELVWRWLAPILLLYPALMLGIWIVKRR